MGLMAHLVKKHGMNNPFILNIAQAFNNFILTCDYLEELPDGKVQFKGMMMSMIRDIYDIDWEDLMGAVQEIRWESSETGQEVSQGLDRGTGSQVLDPEELKEVVHEVHARVQKKRSSAEDVHCTVKAAHILENINEEDLGGEVIGPKLRAAIGGAIKK